MTQTKVTAKRKVGAIRSLLDEEAAVQAILEAGLLDQERAKAHVKNIAHQLFVYEKNVVHKKLLQDMKDGLLPVDKPMEATRVDQEFEIAMVTKNFLPKQLYSLFSEWTTLTSKVVHVSESSDYVTTKLLIELQSGDRIESVILRHNKRTTLCVSSQVGCKMGCAFCATGTLGQRANLTAGEIQEQLFHANRFLKVSKEPRDITNIVFMGMGEPLNNYSCVVSAVSAMTDPGRFGLAPGKVTISTVGVTNRMRMLFKDLPGVSLALSLHAPNQELRQKIIPTASAYPIEKLMDAVREWLDSASAIQHNQYIMIEYILLSGVNDMPELAHELAQLLDPIRSRVKVNLIPYNPIFNPEGLAKTFVPPPAEDVERFRSILQFDHDIFCTVRTEMGQDVNGACGQLACISEQAEKKNVDIEDLYQTRKVNVLYNPETGQNIHKESRTKRRRGRSSTVGSDVSGAGEASIVGKLTSWVDRVVYDDEGELRTLVKPLSVSAVLVGLGVVAYAAFKLIPNRNSSSRA